MSKVTGAASVKVTVGGTGGSSPPAPAVVHVWDPAPICGAPGIDVHPECRRKRGELYHAGQLASPYPIVGEGNATCPSCRRPICLSCRALLKTRAARVSFGRTGGLLRVVSC